MADTVRTVQLQLERLSGVRRTHSRRLRFRAQASVAFQALQVQGLEEEVF